MSNVITLLFLRHRTIMRYSRAVLSDLFASLKLYCESIMSNEKPSFVCFFIFCTNYGLDGTVLEQQLAKVALMEWIIIVLIAIL